MVQQGQGRDRKRRDRRRGEEDDGPELIEKVVFINRVAKVVKGGRRFSFTAVVVIGDGNGRVGYGMGRANEVPEAIRKGGVIARRSMVSGRLREGTVVHETIAKFKASKIVIRPAPPGTRHIPGGTGHDCGSRARIASTCASPRRQRTPSHRDYRDFPLCDDRTSDSASSGLRRRPHSHRKGI